MLLITVSNTDEKIVDEMNYKICEAFSGWNAFKDNDIIVTPVSQKDDGTYQFDVFVGPDKPNQESAPWIKIDKLDEAYRK
jgi:hypothetical protein